MKRSIRKQLINLIKIISIRLLLLPFWIMPTIGFLILILCIIIAVLITEPLFVTIITI